MTGKKICVFVQNHLRQCVFFDKENMGVKYYDFTRLCD